MDETSHTWLPELGRHLLVGGSGLLVAILYSYFRHRKSKHLFESLASALFTSDSKAASCALSALLKHSPSTFFLSDLYLQACVAVSALPLPVREDDRGGYLLNIIRTSRTEGAFSKNKALQTYLTLLEAHLLVQSNQEQEAKTLVETLSPPPSHLDHYYKIIGLFHEKIGELDKALSYYRKELEHLSEERAEEKPTLLRHLAYLSFQADRPEDAERYLEEVIAKFNHSLEAAFAACELADILDLRGNYEKAINRLQRAANTMTSGLEIIYDTMAIIHTRHNELNLAEAALKQAISNKASPQFISPYLGLSHIECRRGRFDKAAEYLDKATEISPDNFSIKLARSGVYIMQGNYTAAIAQLEQAVEQSKQYSSPLEYQQALEIRETLADIYLQKGKKHEAIQEYRRALKAGFDSPEILASLVLLETEGDTSQHSHKRIQAVLQRLRQLLKQKPKNPGLHLSIAKLERRLGNLDQALEHLKHATRSNPHNFKAQLELAELGKLTGNQPLAAKALQQASKAAVFPFEKLQIKRLNEL